MDRFTLDEIAVERKANEQSQLCSRSTQRHQRSQPQDEAPIQPKRQNDRQPSLELLPNQHRLLGRQQTFKQPLTGIGQTAVGSSLLGIAIAIAIWPNLLTKNSPTRNAIATSHTPFITNSAADNSSRQALVGQVLSDRQARTAYLEGDFKALRERLHALGIADEAKEYYLQNSADEDYFNDYLDQN